MKFFKNTFIFVIALFFSLNGFSQTTPVKISDLVGCWTDSREESPATIITVYRPCDYKEFPASRYRFKMELKSKGKCSYLHLASNDAHSMKGAAWTFDEKSGILEITDAEGRSVMKGKVTKREKDLLELESIY